MIYGRPGCLKAVKALKVVAGHNWSAVLLCGVRMKEQERVFVLLSWYSPPTEFHMKVDTTL